MIVRPSAFSDILMDKIYKGKTEIKPLQSLISIANIGDSQYGNLNETVIFGEN